MNISRVFNTIRYMTARQWKYRLYYMARNKLKKRIPKLQPKSIEPNIIRSYYEYDIGNASAIELADGILCNKIPTISGITIDYSGDWDLKNEDYRLVCFRLNSFRWLIDLSDAYKETGEYKYIAKGFELIEEWWEKNSNQISGDKWNAYVIAERIFNWICFCSTYCEESIDHVIPWINAQAKELEASLEFHLGANHLLSEGKALIYAGVFLDNGDMYNCGKLLLLDEAKEQFLPDGGHYERSVSYHVEALQQLFESYVVLWSERDSDAEKFVELMRNPYRYLNRMIGVNGKIPLFNDAAYDYPFYDAADFLATASYIYSSLAPCARFGNYSKRWSWLAKGDDCIEWDERSINESTGFIHYKFDSGENRYSFYMDCGDNGPDYNLGHTHADALSVLLYSNKKEILVDSGVFTYRPDKERTACRATKAHNTVEIDGMNSADVWSAFRVANRGHIKLLDYSDERELTIEASHDGYAKSLKDPVVHIRKVVIRNGKIEIRDYLDSKEQHKAIARFHISPKCTVRQIDQQTCIIDQSITIHSDKAIHISDCNIAYLFGKKENTKCLEIDFCESNSLKTVVIIA